METETVANPPLFFYMVPLIPIIAIGLVIWFMKKIKNIERYVKQIDDKIN